MFMVVFLAVIPELTRLTYDSDSGCWLSREGHSETDAGKHRRRTASASWRQKAAVHRAGP